MEYLEHIKLSFNDRELSISNGLFHEFVPRVNNEMKDIYKYDISFDEYIWTDTAGLAKIMHTLFTNCIFNRGPELYLNTLNREQYLCLFKFIDMYFSPSKNVIVYITNINNYLCIKIKSYITEIDRIHQLYAYGPHHVTGNAEIEKSYSDAGGKLINMCGLENEMRVYTHTHNEDIMQNDKIGLPIRIGDGHHMNKYNSPSEINCVYRLLRKATKNVHPFHKLVFGPEFRAYASKLKIRPDFIYAISGKSYNTNLTVESFVDIWASSHAFEKTLNFTRYGITCTYDKYYKQMCIDQSKMINLEEFKKQLMEVMKLYPNNINPYYVGV